MGNPNISSNIPNSKKPEPRRDPPTRTPVEKDPPSKEPPKEAPTSVEVKKQGRMYANNKDASASDPSSTEQEKAHEKSWEADRKTGGEIVREVV